MLIRGNVTWLMKNVLLFFLKKYSLVEEILRSCYVQFMEILRNLSNQGCKNT